MGKTFFMVTMPEYFFTLNIHISVLWFLLMIHVFNLWHVVYRYHMLFNTSQQWPIFVPYYVPVVWTIFVNIVLVVWYQCPISANVVSCCLIPVSNFCHCCPMLFDTGVPVLSMLPHVVWYRCPSFVIIAPYFLYPPHWLAQCLLNQCSSPHIIWDLLNTNLSLQINGSKGGLYNILHITQQVAIYQLCLGKGVFIFYFTMWQLSSIFIFCFWCLRDLTKRSQI